MRRQYKVFFFTSEVFTIVWKLSYGAKVGRPLNPRGRLAEWGIPQNFTTVCEKEIYIYDETTKFDFCQMKNNFSFNMWSERAENV